jgi:hypothetical protein
MAQTKVTLFDDKTPEQRKAHAAYLCRRDRAIRVFNDGLEFWQMCGRPLCRRNRTCSHDAEACFTRLWALMPEDEKEYWRGCIKAAKHTRVPAEMHRAGEAARDACLKDKERIDALMAASAKAKPAAVPPPEAAGVPTEPDVRIRRL